MLDKEGGKELKPSLSLEVYSQLSMIVIFLGLRGLTGTLESAEKTPMPQTILAKAGIPRIFTCTDS
jgi:hypothetical protein